MYHSFHNTWHVLCLAFSDCFLHDLNRNNTFQDIFSKIDPSFWHVHGIEIIIESAVKHSHLSLVTISYQWTFIFRPSVIHRWHYTHLILHLSFEPQHELYDRRGKRIERREFGCGIPVSNLDDSLPESWISFTLSLLSISYSSSLSSFKQHTRLKSGGTVFHY